MDNPKQSVKHETKKRGMYFLANKREFYTVVPQRDPHG